MLHSNHKENVYKRYTKDNEKGIKACTYKEKKNQQNTKEDSKRKKEGQNCYVTERKHEQNVNSKSFPISD